MNWNLILTALFGLLGVLLGGWITARNQKIERHHNRIREQLDKFYGPMLGMREQILAKSKVRLKISGATGAAWGEIIGRLDARSAPPTEYIQIERERFPDFEKVIKENDRRFIEEIMPLYREMVKHFPANMHLANQSTRQYFGALVEFVEIWERWLDKTIPPEALKFLAHSEDRIKPFYKDLADQLDALANELKGTKGFW